jgi:uncharacterized protein YcbX
MSKPRKERSAIPTDVEFYRQWALKLDVAEDELESAKSDHQTWWQSFSEEAGSDAAKDIMRRYLKMRRRLNSSDEGVRGKARDLARLEPIVRQALGIDDQLDMFDKAVAPDQQRSPIRVVS